jgi:hypothetical protein
MPRLGDRLVRGSPGGVWARDIPLYRRAVSGHRHGGTPARYVFKPHGRWWVLGRPGTTRPISPVFWSWCAATSGGASQLGGQGPVGLPISHSWPNGSMILPMRQPCSSPTGDFWAAPASTAPPRLPRTTLRRRPAARRSRLPRLHGAAPLRQMPSGRTRAPGWPGRPTTPAGYSSWPGFSRSLGEWGQLRLPRAAGHRPRLGGPPGSASLGTRGSHRSSLRTRSTRNGRMVFSG